MNRCIFLFSFLIAACFSLSSCLDDPPSAEEILKSGLKNVDQAQLAADIAVIDDSLAKWNITPLIEPNGVRYTVTTVGAGKKPKLTNYVAVKYQGRLLSNQSVFDQSEGATFQLSQLIIGWQTTLPLLEKGTKVTLYVPSGLAYGKQSILDSSGAVVVPANSNLIFDVEMLDVY